MSYSVWADYDRLGGLNNEHLFLTVLLAEKSKIKMLADLVLSEIPIPGLQINVDSLYPHMAESRDWKPALLSFLMRALNPFLRALFS